MDLLDTLYDAAIAGDADAIAELEMKADILNEDEETILHIESENGNTERVRFILREFANKNLLAKLTICKHTALHLAIYDGHTEVAEVLIDAARHLPSPSSACDNPITSFQAFLRQGDIDMDTALHAAVMKGHVAIVKLLVEADPADKHTQNNQGKTPMYIAVEKGYNEIVEIISKTCTAPSLDGPDCSTVVRIKNLDQDESPGGTLYKIMDRDALYAAAIAGDADAKAHLEMEADKLDAYDTTILHTESKNGNTEHVQFIVREFARKNLLVKLDNTQQTALTWAAYYGHTEVVEVLIDAARHLPSSDDNDTDVNGNPVTSFQAFLRRGDEDLNTALHIAIMQGNLATAKLLVEADPSDPLIQNKKGKTPMYIAVEKGDIDIVKMICTTCTARFSLKGPGGNMTVLHAVIKNLDEAKKEVRDIFKLIIDATKRVIFKDVDEYTIHRAFVVELFPQTDEYGQTMLELAVERNYVEVVELILDIQYKDYWIGDDFISLMPLIYKAKDKGYNNLVKLLTKRYQTGAQLSTNLENQASLISAIRNRDTGSVFRLLKNHGRDLVTFADGLGWTALHHATYNEFDSVLPGIVEEQREFRNRFVYPDMVTTPFYVAAEKGYTSTILLLMELWPSWSSAYTAVDRNGQNILHLSALQSKKETIRGILKYCSEEYKNEFVNKQDKNGNTPLHLLIHRGCFVPELIRYEGLDIRVENQEKWTPPDMLYFEDKIIEDQVQIKLALEDLHINQKKDIFSSSVLPSKRETKDVIFKKQAKLMRNEKLARMKEDTHAIANCFAEAIAGDAISKAALGMEADTVKEEGKTILHVESMKGDTEHVRYIVREFAKKNLLVKLDRLKQTALHLAAQNGHTQVVELLIDAARHFTSENDDTNNPVSSFQAFIRQATAPMGNTALHLAVLNGNVAIVKLLAEADPDDSHVQNNEGKTPIYIAAEKGYKDIVKEICTTCKALSLDGPAGRTTALHVSILNIHQAREEDMDVIRIMINAAKCSAEDAPDANFEALFNTTDASGRTVLELAVDLNYAKIVELILLQDPAYQHGCGSKNRLMRLIYQAIDKEYRDIVKLLSETYEAGITIGHKGVVALILAIKRRDDESVIRLLEDANHLVTFADDEGWTPLHYAAYHEFVPILDVIIKALKDVKYEFVYGDMVSTPFHVAAECKYTSTVIRLMQSWPTSSSAYTAINKNGQNILHLAAANNKKEMIQGILKYCPEKYKDKILEQQDANGDTPLHLLISNGCFVPELIKHKGLDTMAKNKKKWTPRDMLYFQEEIIADQVQIKIALDDVQTSKSWKFWSKSMEKKTDIFQSLVRPSRRETKDVIFNEHKKLLMDAKQGQMKRDLERYKKRTNTQIIVTALITTVTFTVGFTMPGGLHQSGEVDEGLVVLTRKAAFNAFMVSDALALLLSTCSLFLYFLESMYEDPHQVSKLNAASVGLNIVSVMAMMLTFITGTYLVLSHSPALAITVCLIGSFFFIFVIVLLIKLVYDRQVKRNED